MKKKEWKYTDFINAMILFLSIVSIWIICSVKFELSCISVCLTAKSVDQVNEIAVNLSYSYLAGVILYVLTAAIPFYNKKRIYKNVINGLIYRYYRGVAFPFYSMYSKNEEINNNENIQYYIQNELKTTRALIKDIIPPIDNDLAQRLLEGVIFVDNQLKNDIVIYEEYLSEKQIKIVNKIREHQFVNMISSYSLCSGSKAMKDTFYSQFDDYLKYAVELEQTVDRA